MFRVTNNKGERHCPTPGLLGGGYQKAGQAGEALGPAEGTKVGQGARLSLPQAPGA